DVVWQSKSGVLSQAAVARETDRSVAGHGSDDSSGGVHFADAEVEMIRDVNVARSVHVQAGSSIQLSVGGRASVTRESQWPCADHGCNDSRGVHFTNSIDDLRAGVV